MLHKDSSINQRHPFHNWEVADAAALAALVPVAADVGKVALQLDTLTFYVLRDDTGPIWMQLSGGFSAVLVGGQSDLVPEEADSALTLVAGSNMTITTDPVLGTATFSASTGGSGGGVAGAIVLFERFMGF